MSKELFEQIMATIEAQANELGYTIGESAADFVNHMYLTIDCEFWVRDKNGDERAKIDRDRFNKMISVVKDESAQSNFS